MWRNYVICVLVGLLIATSLGGLALLRQSQSTQSQTDQLRQRAAAAEATSASLQQRVGQLSSASPTPDSGNPIVRQSNTPQSVSVANVAPRPTSVAAPAPTVTSPDRPVLQQIESDVVNLRGLQPRTAVPIQFLDQAALNRLFVDRFNQDYLPGEQESDQKLLA